MTSPGVLGALFQVRLEEHVCEMLCEECEEEIGAVDLGLEGSPSEELLNDHTDIRQLLLTYCSKEETWDNVKQDTCYGVSIMKHVMECQSRNMLWSVNQETCYGVSIKKHVMVSIKTHVMEC